MAAPAGSRVAVVEDDDDLRVLMILRLSQRYSVAGYLEGGTFLSDLASFKPEAAVMDRALPDADGLDVERRMRAVSGFARVPVILLSQKTPSPAELSRLGRNTSVLAKAFSPARLLDEAERLLSRLPFPLAAAL